VKEQASSGEQRDGLAAVLDCVREGDTLVVSGLDCLARSTADLLGIVATLEIKRVAFALWSSRTARQAYNLPKLTAIVKGGE
jgi:DNA invertase Pin-like site-specific DNA recombinase